MLSRLAVRSRSLKTTVSYSIYKQQLKYGSTDYERNGSHHRKANIHSSYLRVEMSISPYNNCTGASRATSDDDAGKETSFSASSCH